MDCFSLLYLHVSHECYSICGLPHYTKSALCVGEIIDYEVDHKLTCQWFDMWYTTMCNHSSLGNNGENRVTSDGVLPRN